MKIVQMSRVLALLGALMGAGLLQGCAVSTGSFLANRADAGNGSLYRNFNEFGQQVRPTATPHSLMNTAPGKPTDHYTYY